MPRYEYGHFKPKWYNPLAWIPGVEGTALHVGNAIADAVGIGTLGFVDARRTADRMAAEEMQTHMVTGKDPVINPFTTALLFLAEQAVFDVDLLVGGIISLLGFPETFGGSLAAFATSAIAKGAIDLVAGKIYEAEHYHRARRAHLPMKAISNTIAFGALYPFPGVTALSALAFAGWYGRARARQATRDAARGKV